MIKQVASRVPFDFSTIEATPAAIATQSGKRVGSRWRARGGGRGGCRLFTLRKYFRGKVKSRARAACSRTTSGVHYFINRTFPPRLLPSPHPPVVVPAHPRRYHQRCFQRKRERGRGGERIGGEGKSWLAERKGGSRGDHDTERAKG